MAVPAALSGHPRSDYFGMSKVRPGPSEARVRKVLRHGRLHRVVRVVLQIALGVALGIVLAYLLIGYRHIVLKVIAAMLGVLACLCVLGLGWVFLDKSFSRVEAERQEREQRNAERKVRDRYGVWLTEDIQRLRKALSA